ncbi:MAG: hypothetical protein IIV88_00190 [Erysipelotrichaceae bacterium]|nr:hypothetical protein [Erysipelotrichaceae bacterium]
MDIGLVGPADEISLCQIVEREELSVLAGCAAVGRRTELVIDDKFDEYMP